MYDSIKDTIQGWECPKCHTVYAPTVEKCKQCEAKDNRENEDVRRYSLNYPLDNATYAALRSAKR